MAVFAVIEGGEESRRRDHGIAAGLNFPSISSLLLGFASAWTKSDVLIIAKLVHWSGLQEKWRILRNADLLPGLASAGVETAGLNIVAHLGAVIAGSRTVFTDAKGLPELVLEGRCTDLSDALLFLLHNEGVHILFEGGETATNGHLLRPPLGAALGAEAIILSSFEVREPITEVPCSC